MARVIAGLLGWFGLGIIFAEIINVSKLFDFKLNAFIFAITISFVYLFFQLVLKYLNKKLIVSLKDNSRYQKVKTIYRILFFLIGISCLISIPFLWWGVIKKLAVLAYE